MNMAPLIAGLLLNTSLLSGQSIHPISETGPRDDRINFVYLAEGFTSEESEYFLAATRALDARLRANESWSRFSDWMNSFAVMVPSAESGTDDPRAGVVRDTYFNTTFNFGGIDRALAVTGGSAKVRSFLQQTIPDFDVVVLLVNSTKYGGTGGFLTTVSLDENNAEILLHELGHSFANLVDEYVDNRGLTDQSSAFLKSNLSLSPELETLPWRDFVRPEIALPTPVSVATEDIDQKIVGAFEGAVYRASGVYRPTSDSKMRNLNRPFGPVNLKAFADRVHFMKLGSPEEAPRIVVQPVGVVGNPGGSAVLEVEVSSVGPTTYLWRHDGIYLPDARSPRLEFSALRDDDFGTYELEATNGMGTTVSQVAEVTPVGREEGITISREPEPLHLAAGSAAQLEVRVAGSGQFFYQWFRNGHEIMGANEPNYRISEMSADLMGMYSVEVSNEWGSAISEVVSVSEALPVVTGESRLVNFSARGRILSTADAMLAGVVLDGDGSSNYYLRMIGSGLESRQTNEFLRGPVIRLRGNEGEQLAVSTDMAGAIDQIPLELGRLQAGAFANEFDGSDAVLMATLDSGVYTLEAGPTEEGDTGLGMVELYEIGQGENRIVNVSIRARVGGAHGPLVVGFTLSGDTFRQLLIRAAGPALVDYGVRDVLTDPVIRIDESWDVSSLRFGDIWNDDWGVQPFVPFSSESTIWLTRDSNEEEKPSLPESSDSSGYRALIERLNNAVTESGAFPFQMESLDSAREDDFEPGSYVLEIDSRDGGEGTVLFELYLLRDTE